MVEYQMMRKAAGTKPTLETVAQAKKVLQMVESAVRICHHMFEGDNTTA